MKQTTKPRLLFFRHARGLRRCFDAFSSVPASAITWLVFFNIFCLVTTNSVHATSIESLDSQQLVDRSELVFEGEVVSVQAKRISSHLIVTEVRFSVLEVLGGTYGDEQLVLTFAGGELAENRMHIGEMIYPRVGEQGVYFVESISKPLVNPLVGWAQGHFVYERDSDAVQRVCTAKRVPIMRIEYGSIPVGRPNFSEALRASHGGTQFSHGFARGIRLAESAQQARAGLTRAQFRAQLKSYIKERESLNRLRLPLKQSAKENKNAEQGNAD